MTDLDLTKLRALAEAATPGEWMLWTSCSWRRFGLTDHTTLVMQPIRSPSDGHPDLLARQEDLDYIATFHPAVALALLDELERLRTILGRCHDALAESRASDDETIPDGIREWRASAKESDRRAEALRAEVERLRGAVGNTEAALLQNISIERAPGEAYRVFYGPWPARLPATLGAVDGLELENFGSEITETGLILHIHIRDRQRVALGGTGAG